MFRLRLLLYSHFYHILPALAEIWLDLHFLVPLVPSLSTEHVSVQVFNHMKPVNNTVECIICCYNIVTS